MTTNWLEEAINLNQIAEEIGFRWENFNQILEKINSEAEEVKEALALHESKERISEEIGDLMFAVTSLAYFLSIDPEEALMKALLKFKKRFNFVKQIMDERNINLNHRLSSENLLEIWEEAKTRAVYNGAAGED